jgi:putative oxidoreductase
MSALGCITGLVGRVLIGAVYLAAGLSKFPEWEQHLQLMRSEGMPQPELFLAAAMVLLIGGGLSVLLGWKARLGATALAIFTLPAMVIFNHFWSMSGPRAADVMHLFMANAVMFGACLFIAGNGPGACALDNRGR